MTVAQGANRGGGAELWWGGRKEMKLRFMALLLPFYKVSRQPKSHHFTIIAKLSQKLLHLQFEFSALKYK